jgi:hypothetical protein
MADIAEQMALLSEMVHSDLLFFPAVATIVPFYIKSEQHTQKMNRKPVLIVAVFFG